MDRVTLAASIERANWSRPGEISHTPRVRLSHLLLTLGVLATTPACRPTTPPDELPAEALAVLPAPTLRTDTIGDREQARATFVLADAENRTTADAVVTLRGTLRDAAGAVVGNLRPESLRIPPGGRRTFALVDDADAERPTAVRAELSARGFVPADAPTVVLSEPNVFADDGKVMVAARVTNHADRPCTALVLAGFHDPQERPMTRPFRVLELAAGGSTVVRFVGPQGSAAGYVFLGDVVY